MKSKMNLKSILIMAIIGIISFFFINMSLAANTAKISVETANLRETADENSKILELLSINQEVEIIEKTGDWYKVKAEGIVGYLRQDLLSTNNNQDTSETTSNETNTANTQQLETDNKQNENNTVEVQTAQTEESVQENSKDEIVEIELGKQKVAENTKLKILPIINSTEITELKKDEEVNCTEIINGWVFIEAENAKGWIRKEKINTKKDENGKEETQQQEEQTEQEEQQEEQNQATSKTMFVNTATINLRKEANTSSEIVTTLPVNTAVDVIEEANGWYKVKVSGKEGYISASLLSDKKQETSRNIETPRKSEDSQKQETTTETASVSTVNTAGGASVVEKAKSYIGSSYVYGGSTPSGFDCSGFTSYIYKQYGISLNRTAAGQYSNGTAVDRSNLQAGDLVMFGKSGINHVGIYMGDGNIVHAANPSRGVTIDTINSGYYNNNYVGARRVIN